MGVNLMVFSNHNAALSRNAKEMVDMLFEKFGDRCETVEMSSQRYESATYDSDKYKLFVGPKTIQFELDNFNRIRIGNDFHGGPIFIYKKVICFTGIDKHKRCMDLNFAAMWNEKLNINPDDFKFLKVQWENIKSFIKDVTFKLGGNRFVYVDDFTFEECENRAFCGESIDAILRSAQNVNSPTFTLDQYLDKLDIAHANFPKWDQRMAVWTYEEYFHNA